MQENNTRDIWVGLFVVLGIAALTLLSLNVSNLLSLPSGQGYVVTAEFDNIGGLKVRAPIKLSGVVVGRVESISIDPQSFRAVVSMNIESKYTIFPKDSSAAIYTSGLLGEQYIGISPGAEDALLQSGDRIALTQSAIVLETLISQFLFNKAAEGDQK
jgi:phospholipid/cholesterol/gamma-HCH transport system substrate-binding protein